MKLTVLHVIPGLGAGGGAERSLANTAPKLRDAGIRLHVAIVSDRRTLVDTLERNGVVIHDLSHATGVIARARAIRRLVRDLRPDLVHTSLFEADVPTQLAVGRSLPLIVTWAGTPYSPALRGRPGIVWWKVQIVRAAEAVLGRWSGARYQAVTEGVARENAASLRVDPGRIFVCGRGRSPVPLRTPEDRLEMRAAHGLGAHDEVLLSIARHEPEKGLPDLIDAFSLLLARRPNVQLLVAGRRGSLTAALEAQIDRLGLVGRVRLLGYRNDIEDLLAVADVFVASSVSEGAAGGVVEAMAASVPIVSTATPGMVGVVADGLDALLVPIGDTAALARRIDEVLDDPVNALAVVEHALETFAARFTVDRSAEAVLDMYRSVSEAARVESAETGHGSVVAASRTNT